MRDKCTNNLATQAVKNVNEGEKNIYRIKMKAADQMINEEEDGCGMKRV